MIEVRNYEMYTLATYVDSIKSKPLLTVTMQGRISGEWNALPRELDKVIEFGARYLATTEAYLDQGQISHTSKFVPQPRQPGKYPSIFQQSYGRMLALIWMVGKEKEAVPPLSLYCETPRVMLDLCHSMGFDLSPKVPDAQT